MIWNFRLAVLLLLAAFASAPAQSVIKVLHFDKKGGIIDKGEDAGLRVGDVFDVNRYAGDFVYWIGRVEVVVVKPKAAGIKMLTHSENATIQQGDVLELSKRELDPVSEKPNPAANGAQNAAPPANKIIPAEAAATTESSLRSKPVIFGLTSGLSRPIKNSSKAFGLNFAVRARAADGRTQVIDMTQAFTTSVGLQAFCTLPLSDRMSVNLNYDYIPLNVKSSVESSLLTYGMKASASLMKISAALERQIYHHFHAGLGAGIFLPEVKVNDSRQSITLADRYFGFAASATHWLPLGSIVWLRSLLEYDIYLNNGPAIHYLTLQTGLSIELRKH
jgi:hypothetical protein